MELHLELGINKEGVKLVISLTFRIGIRVQRNKGRVAFQWGKAIGLAKIESNAR